MKKVAGFSLTDVIVTMIISLLIIDIAFSVFRITYNQLFNYQMDNQTYKDLYMLHLSLLNDFSQAEQIDVNNEIIKITFFEKVCQYTFNNNIITRQINNVTDTFKLTTSEYNTLFQDNKQIHGTIDELTFNIIMNNTIYPYKFIKQYPSKFEISNNH